MANTQAPYGFIPVQVAGKEVRAKLYAADNTVAIYPGDALKLDSSGGVTVAAQGERLIGIAAEYKVLAGTEILVYDDPDTVFQAQTDGSAGVTDIGQNFNLTANAADTALKRSKHDLDVGSKGTEAYKQFKCVNAKVTDSNESGNYMSLQVIMNNHEFKLGVSGV